MSSSKQLLQLNIIHVTFNMYSCRDTACIPSQQEWFTNWCGEQTFTQDLPCSTYAQGLNRHMSCCTQGRPRKLTTRMRLSLSRLGVRSMLFLLLRADAPWDLGTLLSWIGGSSDPLLNWKPSLFFAASSSCNSSPDSIKPGNVAYPLGYAPQRKALQKLEVADGGPLSSSC